MKRILFILMFSFSMLAGFAQHNVPPYVIIGGMRGDVEVSDSLFHKIAAGVIFRVNKYDIERNSEFARELVTDVLPLMNEHGMQLERLIFRAAASPEGPIAWNQKLCVLRANALKKLVDEHMIVPSCDDCVEVNEVAVDYPGLLRMMTEAEDADYDYVKSLVDRYYPANPNRIQSELRKSKKLWRKLLDVYFPHLRYARVVLVFRQAHVEALQLEKEEIGELDGLVKIDSVPREMPELSYVPFSAKVVYYPTLAVKTNLLYDLFYTPKTGFQPSPDIEVEWFAPNGRWSVLAEYQFPWWSNEEKREFFQLQNWQLEPRYYLNNNHWYNGHYVGLYAMFNRYDFALKGNDGSGVQGEGAGLGLSYGYVLPLGGESSRWKLEFNIKLGYYETHYDPYDYEYNVQTGEGKYYYRWHDDPNLFRRRNWRYRWVGPTGVGAKISYDIWRAYKK